MWSANFIFRLAGKFHATVDTYRRHKSSIEAKTGLTSLHRLIWVLLIHFSSSRRIQKAEHNKRIHHERKGQIRTVKLRALYLIGLETTVPNQSRIIVLVHVM